MKIASILILFLSQSIILGAQEKPIHIVMEKTVFVEQLEEEERQLVDVRTPEEFERGHLEKALNIDFLDSALFEKQMQQLDKSQPVFIYCRSGARSGKAAAKMIQMGFSLIYDLEGGYMKFKESESIKSQTNR